MRKLLIGTVGAVAVLAIVPFGMGFLVQKDIRNWVAFENQKPTVRYTLSNYHRGWLRSSADIEMFVKMQDEGPDQAAITFHETIYHGPLLWVDKRPSFGRARVDSKVTLSQKAQATLNQFMADQTNPPQFIVQTKIGMTGAFHTIITVPKFQYTKPGRGTYTWLGLRADINSSSDFKASKGELALDGMTVESPVINAAVGRLNLDYKMQSKDDRNYSSTVKVTQPMIQMTVLGTPLFQLNDFNLQTSADVIENLLKGDFSLAIAKLIVHNNQVGPGGVEYVFKNINAEPLHALMKKLNEMQNDPNISPEQQGQIMAMTVVSALPKMLDKGPSLEIKKLELQLPEGLFKAQGKIEMAPASGADHSTGAGPNMSSLTAEGSMQVPVELAKNYFARSHLSTLVQEQNMKALLEKEKAAQAEAQPANSTAAVTTTPTDSTPAFVPATMEELQAKAQQDSAQQIVGWETKGYLKKDNTGTLYTVDIKFANGKLMLNGQEYLG